MVGDRMMLSVPASAAATILAACIGGAVTFYAARQSVPAPAPISATVAVEDDGDDYVTAVEFAAHRAIKHDGAVGLESMAAHEEVMSAKVDAINLRINDIDGALLRIEDKLDEAITASRSAPR